MRWLTDTIAGRTIIVLVLGLGSILALAQYLYQAGIEREVNAGNAERVIERLLLLRHSLVAIAEEKRDDAAHRVSGGPLELHWGREPLAATGGDLDAVALHLRDGLLARSPELTQRGLVIGTTRSEAAAHSSGVAPDDGHVTLLSLPLSDGTWLNVTLARVQPARAASPSLLLSVILGTLGVVAVAILMSYWLTGPVGRLADGASQLFRTSQNDPMPETGPREVRTLAKAINDLQQRIRRLVDDRTQVLAAVSHDLRSPLTRARLRVEQVKDEGVRRSIVTDLDEMEQMIDATLSFLRDDMPSEAVEQVDIAAILETIAADAIDAGQQIEIDVPRSLVLAGRHLALKRALTNLVQNAVKHGGAATISAAIEQGSILIAIRDEGPGIPQNMLETVFEPFYRLDASRNRGTGGHGLGLTVARTIIRAHGGDVTLDNRLPRGLEALVMLPVTPDAA